MKHLVGNFQTMCALIIDFADFKNVAVDEALEPLFIRKSSSCLLYVLSLFEILVEDYRSSFKVKLGETAKAAAAH